MPLIDGDITGAPNVNFRKITSVLVLYWFAASCRTQPSTFSYTKKLPTSPLPYFCSRGELTQTLAGLALKPLPFGLLVSQKLGVLVRDLAC